MKILQKTETHLIIQHRPVLYWASSIIMIISLLYFLYGVILPSLPSSSSGERIAKCFSGSLIILPSYTLLFSQDAKFVSWKFDKFQDILTVEHGGLFGTSVSEYPLQEIRDVQIESGESLFGIQLFLSGNRKISLCSNYSLTDDVAREGINCISTFLNLENSA